MAYQLRADGIHLAMGKPSAKFDIDRNLLFNGINLPSFSPHTAIDINLIAKAQFDVQDGHHILLLVEIGERLTLRGEVQAESTDLLVMLLIDLDTNTTTTAEVINGRYEFDVTSIRTCMVIASQRTGRKWQPDTEYAAGDVVRPIGYNQRLYEVIQGGNGGSVEPSWWLEVSGSEGSIGTATARVVPHFEPKAHGPINITRSE